MGPDARPTRSAMRGRASLRSVAPGLLLSLALGAGWAPVGGAAGPVGGAADPGATPPAARALDAPRVAQEAGGPAEVAAGPPPVSLAPAGLDQGLVQLRDRLRALLSGALDPSVEVSDLFGIALLDAEAVRLRVAALGRELAEGERQLGELRARLAAIESESRADRAALEQAAAEVARLEEALEAARRAAAEAAEADSAAEAAAGADPEAVAAAEEAMPGADAPAPLEGGADSASPREFVAGALEAARRSVAQAEEAVAQARGELVRLRETVERRSARRAQERTEVDALTATAGVRLEVARARLDYLERLRARLERTSEAARRILPGLGQPRAGLRRHAEAVADLADAVGGLGERIERLAERARAGLLVGFVADQRSLASELTEAADTYSRQAERLAARAQDLAELAEEIEAEGRVVAATFLRSVARPDDQAVFDTLFARHLAVQRRLRRRVNEELTTAGSEALSRLAREIESTLPTPGTLATTGDARRLLGEDVERRQRIDAALAAEAAGLSGWALAFENELVTLLAEQASREARAEAYRLSSEMLADVTGELQLAWSRLRKGVERRRSEIPTPAALIRSEAGQGYLARAFGLLVVFGLWVQARRRAPRITVALVRSASRLPVFRGRMGTLVRWSGLLQSVLPPLLALVALELVLLLLGRGTPVAGVVEAIALPLVLYWLGQSILLGATRRIAPGRPPLLELQSDDLASLRRTYATLGLVIAFAYALDGVVRAAVGAGRLASLVNGVVLLWIALWSVWEAIRWRRKLAEAWAGTLDEGAAPAESRLAGWMLRRGAGFVLTPVALLRVLGTPALRALRARAGSTGFVQSLRARILRRRSQQGEEEADPAAVIVPDDYLAAFPLHPVLGEDDALIVPRDAVLAQVSEQLDRWRESRVDGSLVLIGEKGAGKTTLAAQLSIRLDGVDLLEHTLTGKPTTSAALIERLAPALGHPDVQDPDALAEALVAGPERVVVLDEAHNAFLRIVDGYGAYDALVDLVNATAGRVFWVLIFNSFTWQFLNESRGRVHYFRRLLMVPPWTPEEIQQLIRLRHQQTGFELRFDEVLLSDGRASQSSFTLVEGAEGYFRLLWESSGGNPRIATQLWLQSLTPAGERKLGVGLFREPDTDVLDGLQDELVFALAAICHHENLGAAELAQSMNTSLGFARFAMQFLSESGLIEAKDAEGERYTLAPAYYRAVLRKLRSKHLLFS